MSNLRAIKKRIGSVRNTRQITRAMKMVSGAKFRRAEDRIRGFRPYAHELQNSLETLIARDETISHPLMQAGVEGAPPLFVLVSSDRGLCGAFNTNVFKHTRWTLEDREIAPEAAVFYPIGRKARDFVRRRGWTTLGETVAVPEPPSPDLLVRVADTLTDAFLTGVVSSVTLVYNQFVNALVQKVVVEPFLPLERPSDASMQMPHLSEPARDRFADFLLPRLVTARLESVLLDSMAGEHGARMTAMDSASNNASDMIAKLTLTYNRARQAAITSELLDIINGKNAIE